MELIRSEQFNGVRTCRLKTFFLLMGCSTANLGFIIQRTCAYPNRIKLSEHILRSFLGMHYEFQVKGLSGEVHSAVEVN